MPYFAAAGYSLAVLLLFQFVCTQIALSLYESPTVSAATITKPQTAARATNRFPQRLKIPSIHVDAAIRQVGLAADGSMDVPKKPMDAAWYMLGPEPGEIGSAVINGHVNWWFGATGVFARLNSLKPGDKILVQDSLGVETTFVVRATKEYKQNEDASGVFISKDGKSHLNLITCAGVWDRMARMYTKRLVVFADKATR